MKYIGCWLVLCVAIASVPNVHGGERLCGIASEFPPYQFSENGQAVGFDADVARLVFERAGEKVRFQQAPWDELVARFIFSAELNCLVGAEATSDREKLFLFSDPYHQRRSALFVREDNRQIESVEDLVGQLIAGDRDSAFEDYLARQVVKGQLKITETKTKALAMQQLQSGDVQAAIMPREVGMYLANSSGTKVRIVAELEDTSPVAIAVRKNETALHEKINVTLRQLSEEGEIDRLQKRWFDIQ